MRSILLVGLGGFGAQGWRQPVGKDARMFKHYILTRFNDGLYGPNPRTKVPPDEWMDHRLRLFTTFTVPSVMEQTCQNFTWLVLMDRRTPDRYIREIESFRYPNLKLIFPTETGGKWGQTFDPGDYDLITTRIDNDDAFHRDVVEVLQKTYLAERERRSRPWVIVFPFGLIMDLATQDLWVMEYWLNNCPTLVGEPEAGTIYQWKHNEIPEEVGRCFITDNAYWLQVVHAYNQLNQIPSQNGCKILHKEVPAPLEWLTHFSVAPDRLPIG